MTDEKAAEIIEYMISCEKAWLNDFGGKMSTERIEALKKAVEQLREKNNGQKSKE